MGTLGSHPALITGLFGGQPFIYYRDSHCWGGSGHEGCINELHTLDVLFMEPLVFLAEESLNWETLRGRRARYSFGILRDHM